MLELIGVDRIRARINGMLPLSSGNFGQAPVRAGEYMRKQTEEVFQTAGYGAWPKSVREGKTGIPTMRDTQTLLRALLTGSRMSELSKYYLRPPGPLHGDGVTPNARGEPHTAQGIFRTTPKQLEYGVRSAYGHLLNTAAGFVSERYNRWVAGRPFLTITRINVAHIVSNWLTWSGLSFLRPRP